VTVLEHLRWRRWGRKRRGLSQIDPGKHSPELTAFLRRWLTPGQLPGRGPTGWDLPFVERSPHSDDAKRYRDLARGLWSVTVLLLIAVAVFAWLGHPLDGQMIGYLMLAIIAAILGVFAWRAGRH
jgi:hypothetical protein